MTLIKRKLHFIFTAIALLSIAAAGQEPASKSFLLPTPAMRQTTLAPNFRVGDFRLKTLDADNPASAGLADDAAAPDNAPDASAGQDQHPGLVKRSIRRIGQDQKI